ncbi:Beta-ketoacyl synthase, N-terminal domain [seawater metagenome]|uniref:Beta-ketoacyl synthase, N-terminal domain n=1 Tax=seawater metagenome TaxID=1561972 RepID=A0A5E8CI46_9ZZZZ
MNIAIIGISCRLPNGVENIDDLYYVLKNKKDCLKEHQRLNIDKFYDKENNVGKIRNKRGGYVEDLFNFDNSFFKISSKEAKSMDPQQRNILELVYECMTDAGKSTNEMRNSSTGVFMGCCSTEYYSCMSYNSESCNEYLNTGGLLTLLSNRVSYFYDLRGPSLTLDTACSSSGHALHLACQSLKNGETRQCFVGGSNVLLNPESTIGFSQAQMLSPEGKCKAFDKDANGYVRSEGFVVLLIKPLEDAIRDGDNIHCVIKETGVNQDGKTNSITMPNNFAQEALLRQLYQPSDYENIIYIDAHGTGTQVGDKNEALAIGTVLGKNRKEKIPIGSVKTNMGHTEASSGLVSILKICLMMKYKTIFPNLHFNEPNPDIDFNDLNLRVVTKLEEIKSDKMIMGVNNFGFGGANFHCKLENYIPHEKKKTKLDNNLPYQLLAIHGSTQANLENNIEFWRTSSNDLFLENLHNQNKMTPLEHSKIFIVANKAHFNDLVDEDQNSLYAKMDKSNPNLKIGFVFCGQGPQHIDMGFDLFKDYEIFRESILECDRLWLEEFGHSFIETYKLFDPKFKKEDRTEININDPLIAQPAIFFYQIGLLHLYELFGIKPSKVIGHSAGELAAFYASGALDLETCIKISYHRSILQQKTAGLGNMLVIGLSEENLNELVKEKDFGPMNLELACENDPNSIVMAGNPTDVQNLLKFLKENNIFCAIIRGRCAFHSSQQDIIKNEVLDFSQDCEINSPIIPLISTAYGQEVTLENYKNEYWWKNIRGTVKFVDGINQMKDINIFIEIGPHPVLKRNIQKIHDNGVVMMSSHMKEDSSIRLMTTIAELWSYGYKINKEIYGISNKENYLPFQWDKKYFINEPEDFYNKRQGKYLPKNLIQFSKLEFSYMVDHVIGKKFLFPTVGYLDIINRYFSDNIENLKLEDFEIFNMYTPDDLIKLNWTLNDNTLEFFSAEDKTPFVKTRISKIDEVKEEKFNVQNILDRSKSHIDGKEAYQIMKSKNFNFGSQIKSIDKFYYGDEECLILLSEKTNKNFKINPTYLDSCLTSAVIYLGYTNTHTYLPTKITSIEQYFSIKKEPKYVYTKIIQLGFENMIQESLLIAEDDTIICRMEGIISSNVSQKIDYNINYNLSLTDVNQTENNQDTDNNILVIGNYNIELEQNLNKKYSHIIYSKCMENISLIDLKKDLLTLREYPNILFLINKDHDGLHVGFLRSFINENININVSILVLSDNNELNNQFILDLLNSKYEYCSEYEVNHDKLMTPKLEKLDLKPDFSNQENYYFNIDSIGNFNSLGYYPLGNINLEKDNVIIEVKSSAINFKDIMVCLGVVKSDYLGYELAGVIKESSTPEFNIGDIVIASPNKSGKGISNIVQCHKKYVFKAPSNLSFNELACIGLVFGTSYCCLIERANIKKTDTVLIHSALGGIGQASIEICKMIGCKIIASVGTQEKRDILKEKYNINLITNSRDPEDFKRDVLKFTDNKGVDVILNSLAGKSLVANFDIIAKGGRIVEIGKRDILNNFHIPLEKFIDSITYSAIHFDELLESHSEYIKNIMTKMLKLFEDEKLKPIEITSFHISEATKALKFMSKGIHTGKLILEVDDWKPTEFHFPKTLFDSKKYYLISGGLGGLGVELMNWMSNKGARKFILLGRSGRISKRAARNINYIEELGGNVEIGKVDISDFESLNNYLESKNFEIDGIFHLAGLLRDNMIENMTDDDISQVLKPKVQGCINLDLVSRNYDINYFVTFSSISALIGNTGQANYSAANHYMDKFCNNRKLEGLPGLSINVGAIGGTGMIDNNMFKIMKSNGFSILNYFVLFENMGRVLSNSKISNVCISNQDWSSTKHVLPKVTMLSEYKSSTKKRINSNSANDIKNKIAEHIKEILEIENIDMNENLINLGVDSITAMEISSFCKDNFNITLSQIDILQGISINSIVPSGGEITDCEEGGDDEVENKKIAFITHLKELTEIEEDLDPNTDLKNYGIDSIVAMEIANWASSELDIQLSQMDLLQGITINQIFNISNKSENKTDKVQTRSSISSGPKIYEIPIQEVEIKEEKTIEAISQNDKSTTINWIGLFSIGLFFIYAIIIFYMS